MPSYKFPLETFPLLNRQVRIIRNILCLRVYTAKKDYRSNQDWERILLNNNQKYSFCMDIVHLSQNTSSHFWKLEASLQSYTRQHDGCCNKSPRSLFSNEELTPQAAEIQQQAHSPQLSAAFGGFSVTENNLVQVIRLFWMGCIQ